jgi:acyl-coenzyme A synthetase/AMP-(fatty) acid ligase
MDYDCCVVIYTSGSTGNPKGVRLQFGAFSNSAALSDENHMDYECCVVIYTSGSTGNPKGVRLQFGAFSNYAAIEQVGYSLFRPHKPKVFRPRLFHSLRVFMNAGEPHVGAQCWSWQIPQSRVWAQISRDGFVGKKSHLGKRFLSC